MLGRNRRVRLLLVFTLFAITVLYVRRSSIEPFVEQAQSVVGGGSVIRPNAPVGPAYTQSLPVLGSTWKDEQSDGKPPPLDDVVASPFGVATTSINLVATSTPDAQPGITAPSEPWHLIPPLHFDDDPLPQEVGQGRVTVHPTPSQTSIIHWESFPEHFPVSSTIPLPTGSPKPLPRLQKARKGADAEKLAIIKRSAEFSWQGYKDYAFRQDELKPVTGGANNPFNGWGATLVDSLDTLWIMGMKGDFEDAVNAVAQIDFTTSARADIPLFETTIRYLGGLMAAYDVSGRSSEFKVLLDKAVELGEVLYAAFDTPNRMPIPYYRWKPTFASQPHRSSNRIVLAELGSLNMEFTRLAQLTGESKYYDAIARVTDALEDFQNRTRVPGLWATRLDASGCEKPSQIGHSTPVEDGQFPVGDKGNKPAFASEPIRQEVDNRVKQAQSLQEMEMSVAHKEPTIGKIIGHGDPIQEGSLDDQNAKAKILAGEKLEKRQVVGGAPPVGNTIGDGFGSGARGNDATKAHTSSNGPPQIAGAEVCVPRGLASTSMGGTEMFTLAGLSDSTYEYLPKEYVLLGGQVEQYRTMYEYAADTAIDKLLFRPMLPNGMNVLVSGNVKSARNSQTGEYVEVQETLGGHLDCFVGGMFALGGVLFDRPADVDIGAKLTDGCVWAYNSTATGIMPEHFETLKCANAKGVPAPGFTDCEWNETRYREALDPFRATRTETVPEVGILKREAGHGSGTAEMLGSMGKSDMKPKSDGTLPGHAALGGQNTLPANLGPAPTSKTVDEGVRTQPLPLSHDEFVDNRIASERIPAGMTNVGGRSYVLRPEAIESVFYMYRLTGDQHWRDAGWHMWESVQSATVTPYGHAQIDDVTKASPEPVDSMESFWISETLKYFYLLFDDEERWSLDDWVLNTEAHFFQRPDAKGALETGGVLKGLGA